MIENKTFPPTLFPLCAILNAILTGSTKKSFVNRNKFTKGVNML